MFVFLENHSLNGSVHIIPDEGLPHLPRGDLALTTSPDYK